MRPLAREWRQMARERAEPWRRAPCLLVARSLPMEAVLGLPRFRGHLEPSGSAVECVMAKRKRSGVLPSARSCDGLATPLLELTSAEFAARSSSTEQTEAVS